MLKRALHTFGCALFGIYGLTETTGAVGPARRRRTTTRTGPGSGSCSRWGARTRGWSFGSWTPPTGSDCAPGQVGEVWLRAPNVMAGYFNRPDETAAALSVDGWLRTGDGGYRDGEGYLFLTDRIKDMIVSGGENVYPVEVEEALAQHSAIDQVAVIGVPDERWGETVKALIVLRPGAAAESGELVAFLRARLASYKLPRIVEFVDELPRTPSGKVLKRELRERHAAAQLPTK